jgi:hypothetical protein
MKMYYEVPVVPVEVLAALEHLPPPMTEFESHSPTLVVRTAGGQRWCIQRGFLSRHCGTAVVWVGRLPIKHDDYGSSEFELPGVMWRD